MRLKLFNWIMLCVVVALLACNSGCGTIPMTEQQAESIAARVGNVATGILGPMISAKMPDSLKVGTEAPGGVDPLSGLGAGAGGGVIGMAVLWVLNALRKKEENNIIRKVEDRKIA